jgi:hypothetical protein
MIRTTMETHVAAAVAGTWIDAHLDLAYLARRGRDLTRRCASGDVGCVCLPALRDAGVELVFGTLFTEPRPGAEAEAAAQLEVYRALEKTREISILRGRCDLGRGAATPPGAAEAGRSQWRFLLRLYQERGSPLPSSEPSILCYRSPKPPTSCP